MPSAQPDKRVRYDGIADWYDLSSGADEDAASALRGLLGGEAGRCLDLGCGTGQYFTLLSECGGDVVGVDLSMDQLQIAHARHPALVRSEGERLPFASASFDTVAAIWVTTDVQDVGVVFAEAARVLRSGGQLVVFGVHPCFNGPLVEPMPDGSRLIHVGYREARWHEDAPWWGDGIRRRTGMRHVPLAELFGAVIGAGLTIEKVIEPRHEPVPFILGISARRAPS
jgi:SAM-dependent methyltransferase